jgi:telomerase reverse transcriptase
VSRQERLGHRDKPLYLAKVDVQACFDTVPQEHLLEVATALLSSDEYTIENHAKVKPPQVIAQRQDTVNTKAVIKFHAHARPANNNNKLEGQLHLPGRQDPMDQGNVIAVGPLGHQSHRKQAIAELLREHVEYNIVKIGKKYYRQKNGIPQGSVLSSLLCNFFYGSLEKDILQFTKRDDTFLIRLIDDFLLITQDKSTAVRFLEVMHGGIPNYGISVKPEKSLVNFDCCVNEQKVPRCLGDDFSYCGLLINDQTLDIKKNAATRVNTSMISSFLLLRLWLYEAANETI